MPADLPLAYPVEKISVKKEPVPQAPTREISVDATVSTISTVNTATENASVSPGDIADNIQNTDTASHFLEKSAELFASQKTISPKDELTKLRIFDGIVTPHEKVFFNAFQAKMPSKHQTIRINISFNRDFFGKGKDFCIAIKDELTQQFLNFVTSRDIQLLRSDDPGYIVISVKNQIFLQIFATTINKPNKFKAYFTNFSDLQKFPIIFEEKPVEYDGTHLSCEDFW